MEHITTIELKKASLMIGLDKIGQLSLLVKRANDDHWLTWDECFQSNNWIGHELMIGINPLVKMIEGFAFDSGKTKFKTENEFSDLVHSLVDVVMPVLVKIAKRSAAGQKAHGIRNFLKFEF